MKKRKDGWFSLKWSMSAAVALSWVVPIIIVVSVSLVLLNRNYENQISREITNGTEHAMEQVRMRFGSTLEASKAASYDGLIQSAYREYEQTGNKAQLYKSLTGYLSKAYSRDANLNAVFISFWDHPDSDYFYLIEKGSSSYGTLQKYRVEAKQKLIEKANSMDTGIAFLDVGGELYMVRNLLNLNFEPYAILAMQCNKDVIFQSLGGVTSLSRARITVDDTVIPLAPTANFDVNSWDKELETEYTMEVGGHTLTFKATAIRKNLWGAVPELRSAILTITVMVIPLTFLALIFFYQYITHPVELLVEASNRVEQGERGFQITEKPKAREFRKLTRHFNSMSTTLKNQFEKIYLEQQALQDAKIKALQSQINPHFLGNTLEIINWEARLAENDKVGAMIEALSTMLDAAIGRDGRSLISLEEELKYVDAYLYIIQQRMGSGLTIEKEVDPALLQYEVPRLVLQPLVENAVEHDISRRRESQLSIRAYAEKDRAYLEVEHDGIITEEDQKKIADLLDLSPENMNRRGHVGIRNLNQRIRLIFGEKASFTIRQSSPGRILAQICFPGLPESGNIR